MRRVTQNFGGIVFLVASRLLAAAPIEDDGISWDFQNITESVAAIGDIHADPESFVALLREMKLVSGNPPKWSGQKTHLVLIGDLIDRGHDSKGVMDLVIQLKAEAAEAGGKIHDNLGNHEILAVIGAHRYISELDRKKLADPVKIFTSSESLYAKDIAARNTFIRINRTGFVHAGLSDVFLYSTPGQINSLIRRWIRHYQSPKTEPSPGENLDWAISERGKRSPLWVRNLNASIINDWTKMADIREQLEAEGDANDSLAEEIFEIRYRRDPKLSEYISEEILENLFSRLGIDRLVIGHTVTDDHDISLQHPLYGGKVIEIDTGLSRAMGGQPRGLWIRNTGLEIVRIDALPPVDCKVELKKVANKRTRNF